MAAEQRFRFRPDVLRAAAARTRRRVLVSVVVTAAAVVAVWAWALRPRGDGPGALVMGLGLVAVLAVLSLRKQLARVHARWSSFEVTVSDEEVSRVVEGFPAISIARADVAAVEERAAGVVVRGADGASLLLPRDLDGYDRARDRVVAWARPPG